jgi:DNA-binding NarL/FixJ family response regulator
MRVHVIVAEADPLTCEGLAESLCEEPRLSAYPCNDSPLAALDRARDYDPCVVLVSEAFLEKIDVLRFIAKADYGRGVPVLALGPPAEPERVIRSLLLGCMGYVSRRDSLATLKKAIFAVAGGEIWARRADLTLLVRRLLHHRDRGPQLTAREREILALIHAGCPNAEISRQLFISPETVRWHVRHLFTKIGVRDRASVAEFARLHFFALNPKRLQLLPAVLPVQRARSAVGRTAPPAVGRETVGIAPHP